MILRHALLILLVSGFCSIAVPAQNSKQLFVNPVGNKVSQPETKPPAIEDEASAGSLKTTEEKDNSSADPTAARATQFRLERTPLVGGQNCRPSSGCLTVCALTMAPPEVPLVSRARHSVDNNSERSSRYV
jgi:hypothetical protein